MYDYDKRCVQAVYAQGLDKPLVALAMYGYTAEIFQIGGFCMMLGVTLEDGRYLTVTADGDGEATPYLWVLHSSRAEYELDEGDNSDQAAGTCDDWNLVALAKRLEAGEALPV